MDWINTKVELINDFDTLTEQDLLEENYFEHFGNNMATTITIEEEDSQPVFCSSSLINALSDTALSSELASPGEKLLNISVLNSESVMTGNSFADTDTNFGENIFQLSCLGSDSTDLLSPTQFNDSETEWILSGSEGSHLKKSKVKCTGRDKGIGMINFSRQGSDDGSRRSYCIGNSNSKNAIAARDNRLKKKKYIADLEETVSHLQVENERLQEESKKNGHTMCKLQNEVSYLRKVIANQSTLSAILKNVMKTPGVTLTTSFNSAMNCNSLKEKISDDSRCDRICNGNIRGKKDDTHCVDAKNQTDSVSDAASSRNSRRASKRNVKGKAVHANSQKRCGSSHENKEPPTAVDNETFGDSDVLDVSIDNIQGGICLHVSGQNVSLEFCPLCNKNAYSGLISDHSYVKS